MVYEQEREGGPPPETLEDEQQDGTPSTETPEVEGGQQPQEAAEERIARLEQALAHEQALKRSERQHKRQAQSGLTAMQKQLNEMQQRLEERDRQREEADRRVQVEADRRSRAAAADARLGEALDAGDQRAVEHAKAELTAIKLEAARDLETKPEAKRPEPKPEPRAAEPEPEQVEYPDAAVAWMGRTPWYHSAQNERDQRDAQTAYNVLQGLQAQGYDTSVPEFYQAADNILRGILPHRYQQQQRQTMEQPRGNGVARTAGAGRGNGTGDNREPAIPPGVLEKARRMGRPVNDPEYRKRLAKYVLNPSGDRP